MAVSPVYSYMKANGYLFHNFALSSKIFLEPKVFFKDFHRRKPVRVFALYS